MKKKIESSWKRNEMRKVLIDRLKTDLEIAIKEKEKFYEELEEIREGLEHYEAKQIEIQEIIKQLEVE